MNLQHFGVQLIWAMGQVTLVLALGLVLYFAAARRGPAMRSLFAAGTLAVSLVMTLLAMTPWPRWHNVSLVAATTMPQADESVNDDRRDETDAQAADGEVSDSASLDPADTAAQPRRRATELESPTRAAMSAFWQSLNDNLATPAAANDVARSTWQWPGVLAVVFLAGITFGIIRIGVGLWAVARYRRGARPIDDPQLLAELAELQTALGCRDVMLCESTTIGTPATIGWRRPLVLLPADWRDWNETDRRAVIAHELAHVSRGDYLSGVVARLTTALHFYHPLAHWLARRMRFEQELAADACGVACSGGKESYVVALARMALYQDNRVLAWAARPFLPSRSTFLRRIEMLRNTSQLAHAPYAPVTRRLLLAGLAAVAIVIAGLRGPIVSSNSVAEAQQAGGGAAAEKIDLAGVPYDTVVYAAIRPAAILARDAKLRETIGMMEQQIKLRENAGISLGDVEEFRLMVINAGVVGSDFHAQPIIRLRAAKAEALKSLTEKWMEVEETTHGGQKYFRPREKNVRSGDSVSYFAIDERTLVFSPAEEALKLYINTSKGDDAPPWAAEFKRIEGGDAALAVDMRFFAKLLEKEFSANRGGADAAMAVAFAPLWRNTNAVVAGARAEETLKAEVHAVCKSEQAAEEVAATVTAVRVLAQNMLPIARQQVGKSQSPDIGKFETALLEQAEKFLAQVKPTREGKVVSLKIEGTEAFGPLVAGLLLPAVAQARDAAQRAQSTNNLKQIALAMHNYHDVHKHFPPAAVLGPDGKTPHSWRVAILPYLEQQELYNQYKFNEAWDSESNSKLLAKMPAVYRHPSTPGIAGNQQSSSYYALTGKGAIFNSEPSKTGTGFAKITDGTSNTVLIVEAKRDIPWTKPEDIPFDPEKELPKLGGYAPQGFSAAAADGSVRFISHGIDQRIFKLLVTMGDGQPVDWDQGGPGGRPGAGRPGLPGRVPTPQEALRRQ
jgi:beta-lactamase regulating signal transducer with metallopeptidase domain